MARGEFLFSTYELRGVLDGHGKKARDAVEQKNGDLMLSASPEDVLNELEEEFRVRIPVLGESDIQMDQVEAQIDVSHDRERYISDRSQPFYLKGTEVKFFVPYEGDKVLFDCHPSSYTLNPPCAAISDTEIILAYTRLDQDAAAIRIELDRDLSTIKQWLGWVENDVKVFNGTLRSNLQQWIAARRDKLLKDRGMVAALGFPLRRRGNASQTYASPTVRRKPAISKAATTTTTRPFQPEPTLELGEYEHILSVICSMVQVMERSPHAFKGMKEEDLRQHFLVQLNGHYEGQATGETFNFEGKTDILIRDQGKNLFIAECKFWNGPDSMRNAMDQILGYTCWRDTKTALLIFNRQKNFSDVLAKVPEVAKAHPNFKRQEKYASETGFRFILHHRDDKSRDLTLTILAFEIPA